MPKKPFVPMKQADIVDDLAALDAEIAADAADQSATPDQLARITSEGLRFISFNNKAKRAEEEMDEAKKQAREIAEKVLPNLMDEAGIKLLGLDDDFTLERDEAVYASISKENAPAATAWMEENGYGPLIKFSISITMEKGDAKLAARVRQLLAKNRIPFEEVQGVHPQTLLAFVKESIEKGRQLPKSITTHIQPVVKLKQKKSKARK